MNSRSQRRNRSRRRIPTSCRGVQLLRTINAVRLRESSLHRKQESPSISVHTSELEETAMCPQLGMRAPDATNVSPATPRSWLSHFELLVLLPFRTASQVRSAHAWCETRAPYALAPLTGGGSESSLRSLDKLWNYKLFAKFYSFIL